MRTFLLRLIIGVVVLGLLSIFLIKAGTWGHIVEAAGVALGQDAAEKVDEFGQGSQEIGDKLSDYVNQTYENAQNGNYAVIDYTAITELADALNPLSPGQRTPDYRRDAFGEAWADVDGNGCDTRNDILARDLTNLTFRDDCVVLTGTLDDPYTGKTIQFKRGADTSAAVQIDHIRSLSDAWAAGAYSWTDEQRAQFANDPANLLASDGPTNTSKSDKGPEQWSPPNDAYDCEYVAAYVLISTKYNLPIEQGDRDAIEWQLAACQ